jgi:hypothetical protein
MRSAAALQSITKDCTVAFEAEDEAASYFFMTI